MLWLLFFTFEWWRLTAHLSALTTRPALLAATWFSQIFSATNWGSQTGMLLLLQRGRRHKHKDRNCNNNNNNLRIYGHQPSLDNELFFAHLFASVNYSDRFSTAFPPAAPDLHQNVILFHLRKQSFCFAGVSFWLPVVSVISVSDCDCPLFAWWTLWRC